MSIFQLSRALIGLSVASETINLNSWINSLPTNDC